jgi:Na+-translocating ferredoxin:NAD+ oxidoreductase subunit D
VPKLFILIGCAYLVWRTIIDIRVPVAMVLGAGITALLYSQFNLTYTAYHLLSGSIILGAVYMVTDYSSGPLTLRAKIVYAFLVGVLTSASELVSIYLVDLA